MLKSIQNSVFFKVFLLILLSNFISSPLLAAKRSKQEKAAARFSKFTKKIEKKMSRGESIMLMKIHPCEKPSNLKGFKKFLEKFAGPSQGVGIYVSPVGSKKKKYFKFFRKGGFFGSTSMGYYSAMPGDYTIDEIVMATEYAGRTKYRLKETVKETLVESRVVNVNKRVTLRPQKVVYLGELHLEANSYGDYQMRYTFSPHELQRIKNTNSFFQGKTVSRRLFRNGSVFKFARGRYY